MTYNTENLSTDKIYLISNKSGEYRFSNHTGNKYTFWRFDSRDKNRRITVSLTLEQVQKQVWERVTNLNLSGLESFRGL